MQLERKAEISWFYPSNSWAYLLITSLLMRDGSAPPVLPKASLRAAKTEGQTKRDTHQGIPQAFVRQPASPLPRDQVKFLPRGCDSIFWFSFAINHSLRACAQSVSCVQLSGAPWTIAHQAPLPMKFPRQEHWCALPFPSPRHLPPATSHPRDQTHVACIGRWLPHH